MIQVDVNLKGGLGISLVNSVPEELLYISLRNIVLLYRENARAVTMEMTVSNIQVTLCTLLLRFFDYKRIV